MSSSHNHITLLGRVGREPETRTTRDGTNFTTLSLATSETWKDKQTGEKKERTDWHRVKFAGRLAEVAASYVNSGDLLLVSGQLRNEEYTDKDGNKKRDIFVRADNLTLMPKCGDSDTPRERQGVPERPASSSATRPAPAPATEDDFDSDLIPF